jgi:hypothetical protein
VSLGLGGHFSGLSGLGIAESKKTIGSVLTNSKKRAKLLLSNKK